MPYHVHSYRPNQAGHFACHSNKIFHSFIHSYSDCFRNRSSIQFLYSSFNAANSQIQRRKAPITYLYLMSLTVIQLKQHHLCNIILYDIVYYLKHEQTTRNLRTDILRMHPSLCGKQYLVHVHVNQLSVWGFTSSPLPLLDLPPEHLQYIQVHANCSLDRACLFSVCYFLELMKSAR